MSKQIFPIIGVQVAEVTVHLHFTAAIDHEDVSNFVIKTLTDARLAGEFKSDEPTLLLGVGSVGTSWFDDKSTMEAEQAFVIHAIFSPEGRCLGTHDEPCELDGVQSVPMVLKSKFDDVDAAFYAAEDQILGLQQELERKEAVIVSMQPDREAVGKLQGVVNDIRKGALGKYNAEGLRTIITKLREDSAGGTTASMADLDSAANALEYLVGLAGE